MPNDKSIEEWIERINNDGTNLSVWEESFMESVTAQWERTGRLSEKQIEIVERIYAEHTP